MLSTPEEICFDFLILAFVLINLGREANSNLLDLSVIAYSKKEK